MVPPAKFLCCAGLRPAATIIPETPVKENKEVKGKALHYSYLSRQVFAKGYRTILIAVIMGIYPLQRNGIG
jgi:hypothetical protein